MALPESAVASSVGAPFGSDLHGFIEQYERAYPDEVLHIEEPLRAEWGNRRAGDEAGEGAPLSALGFAQCHRRWQTSNHAADHFFNGQTPAAGAGHGRRSAESRPGLLRTGPNATKTDRHLP